MSDGRNDYEDYIEINPYFSNRECQETKTSGKLDGSQVDSRIMRGWGKLRSLDFRKSLDFVLGVSFPLYLFYIERPVYNVHSGERIQFTDSKNLAWCSFFELSKCLMYLGGYEIIDSLV